MIIDGKKIAGQILEDLKKGISSLSFTPILCDVLVGDDPVSKSYVNIKQKTAQRAGLDFCVADLPETASEDEAVSEIEKLNARADMCGIIVQLPLPGHIRRQAVLDAIDPYLDVDCLHSRNLEQFYGGSPVMLPPTAQAIIAILKTLPLDLSMQNIVVVGQGALVGRPVSRMLDMMGIIHKTVSEPTEALAEITRAADVIISGTGQPKLLTGDMVKPGCVVVDAGTAESSGSIVGDVDFDSVSPKADYISPVPGGVGPVTVAMLLSNAVAVAKRKF